MFVKPWLLVAVIGSILFTQLKYKMKTYTIDETISILQIALSNIVNFETSEDNNNFVLDVVDEYKLISKQMKKENNFLDELESRRKHTQRQFDRLVIKRFREMVQESASPEMFKDLEKDIRILKVTRGININSNG